MKCSYSEAPIEAVSQTFHMIRSMITRMDFQYEHIIIFEASQRTAGIFSKSLNELLNLTKITPFLFFSCICWKDGCRETWNMLYDLS